MIIIGGAESTKYEDFFRTILNTNKLEVLSSSQNPVKHFGRINSYV